jgi:hypothetical protein
MSCLLTIKKQIKSCMIAFLNIKICIDLLSEKVDVSVSETVRAAIFSSFVIRYNNCFDSYGSILKKVKNSDGFDSCVHKELISYRNKLIAHNDQNEHAVDFAIAAIDATSSGVTKRIPIKIKISCALFAGKFDSENNSKIQRHCEIVRESLIHKHDDLIQNKFLPLLAEQKDFETENNVIAKIKAKKELIGADLAIHFPEINQVELPIPKLIKKYGDDKNHFFIMDYYFNIKGDLEIRFGDKIEKITINQ